MDDASKPLMFEVGRAVTLASDPVQAEEGRLRVSDTAARAFTLIARSALGQIAANAAVLRDARRLEAVHQLRVGVRRLRAALALFEPMLAGDGREAVKTELKWLAGEMNDARNLDVFIAETFRPAARSHRDWPGMAALGKNLLAAQTKAYDRAQTAARSARFGVLMLETTAWVESGDWTQTLDTKRAALRTRPIAKLAPEVLQEGLAKVLKKGRKLADLEPHERHKLRLHGKQLRYAAGFFADLYVRQPKAHKRFSKALQGLQTALGDLNDIADAAHLAAEVTGALGADEAAAAPAAFAAGLVTAHRLDGETDAKRASLIAWRRLRESKPFW